MTETEPHSQGTGAAPQHRLETRSIGAQGWMRALWRTYIQMDERNLGLIAAGVGFYAFLSLFPAMAAVIAIWGYWADPVAISEQMELLTEVVPEAAYELLSTQVTQLISANESTLKWASILSIVLAIWSARASVAALIRGLNAVCGMPHRANPVRRVAVAYGMTALLVLVALLAFAAVVVVPALLSFVGLPASVEVAVEAVKWLVLLAVIYLAIALVYRYGPNRKRTRSRMRWATPGAVLAVLGWATGSLALAIYVRNFGSLNEVYGSLGAVVALLMWFYISALVTLLGAQLNEELEAQMPQIRDAAEPDPAAAEASAAQAGAMIPGGENF
ncbi:YihY/virulence factor BrkB family protein [Salipiger marinus]|jgi:membrane protein|uniref:YihY/virulence factor BrkB family protein n=1 Tax=Salipiger marinus TaxID=555512 RepID=UPI000E853A2A|nr:YihY/virulence factor BrkB family protein [Salipiger manganoxidans]MCD1620139.1 YihY/virulence factor BrkB family protein [Salipiger manganoxidans]MEB3421194.1 YihY/virulence factor BrkB family protein [Salipiger manganoxidans]HBM60082.1 ribonuclease BN [Citreicella sp.]|tara:strand:+ start:1921 stop:2913 length:993 start_codon:yes stop_codon:yes gene_type:complete